MHGMVHFRRTVLLIALFPLVDLVLLGWLGAWISWRYVVLLILATAAVGVTLLVREARAFRGAAARRAPGGRGWSLAEALPRTVAAVLLILPGPLGDLLGLALLVRPLRQLLVLWVVSRLLAGPADRQSASADPTIIDVEHAAPQPQPEKKPRIDADRR